MSEFNNILPEELLPQWQYEDTEPDKLGLKWEAYASIPERKRQKPWAGITENYINEIESVINGIPIGTSSSDSSFTTSTIINLNQLSSVGASKYDVIQMTDNGWQVQKFKLEQ